MNMSGQTINDRLLAARHSIAGQGLAKSVCKSTTEEVIGPKKKHLDYLIHCTNEPNVSIPQLANLLIERTQNTSWVVVFKALITVHHLMCYGNERFTQYLASSNCTFQLSNFLDKSGVAGYDMSTFIRRYAKYLNEKALSYRTVAFDFCKVKRGKEDGTLRTMTAEKLLKTLPVLQNQLDALLEFDCTANELTNGVINTAFMLLFRDLIRLFACYNDGIINLLEKYFDMNKKQCREALDVYKKFLIRMDKVADFLKVAENVGIDKGEIPDLTKAPSSLLDALEQHLGSLEGKKVTTNNQTRANIKSAVTAFSTTSNAFGNVVSASSEVNGAIDEGFKQKVLAEEEAMMNQMKNSKTNPSTNPFLSSPGNSPEQVAAAKAIDLFSVNASMGAGEKLSDDLLQLGNPFADLLSGAETSASNNTLWGNQNGTTVVGQGFASDTNFAAVFGGTNSTVLNTGSQLVQESNSFPPGSLSSASDSIFSISDTHNVNPMPSFDVLANLSTSLQSSQPAGAPGHLDRTLSTGGPGSGMFGSSNSNTQGFDAFGDVLQPLSTGQATPKSEDSMNTLMMQESKIITSDLDSSLASLTQNLNLAPAGQKTAIQWGSPKTSAKPGMTNWNPQPMQAIGTANYRPMGSGSVKCNDWAGGMNVGVMSPPVFNSISNPIQSVWGPTQLPQQPGLMGGPVTTGVPQATSNTLFDPFDNL